MKRKVAFTLAEVLITLAIIGVIAAMSVPTLIQSTNEEELRVAWKNGFGLLSQAFNNIDFSDYKDMSTTTKAGGARTIQPFLESKLKYIKSSAAADLYSTAQLANNYKDYSQKQFAVGDANSMDDGQIILNNGMLVLIEDYNGTGNEKPVIWLDVNGFDKGPNVLGKDLQGMVVSTNNTLVPFGGSGSGVEGASCSDSSISCVIDGGATFSSCAGICHASDFLFKGKK